MVRKSIWAALVLSVALASAGNAQTTTTSGGKPGNMNFKPVSTTKHLAAPVTPPSTGFLSRFVPKISLPGFSKSPTASPGPLPAPGPVPSANKNPFPPLAPFTPK